VIKSAHKGGVTWMDLDPVEQRYLLAGAADASLAVYDTQQPTPGSAGAGAHHLPLFTITKQSPGAHAFSVSSVCWYPVDTGLFVSGGFDCQVKVWDANALAVAAAFALPARVHVVAMSPDAASHCLVAAGGAGATVALCDVASGGSSHTLEGHRAGVWAAAWSPTCEWELATGSADGQVRVWDIRRAGALHVLDQHHTAGAAPPAAGAAPGAAPGAPAPGGGGGGPGERQRARERAALYAQAHDGAVTGLAPTPDGLFWLSAGTDDRLRLWDAATRANALVHYPNAFNRASKARQLAVTADGGAVFHPSGSAVQVFDVRRGGQLALLGGAHFDSVNCCRWAAAAGELYTGANDCNIVVWAGARGGGADRGEGGGGGDASDGDAWSD
jgi:DNA excision repair protein ERCC-8